MSTQLHKAMLEILAMPYFKNEHAKSGKVTHGHEIAVSNKFVSNGFQLINKTNFPKLKKSLLKEFADTNNDSELRLATVGLPLGSIILQPSGSQGFPDILLYDFNNRFISIECKSGKNGECPMWNDSIPRQESIYILSSGIKNSTTMFLGKDVISVEETLFFKKQQEYYKKIDKEFLLDIKKLDKFKRGWQLKVRPQYSQFGGQTITNYFNHVSRKQCEQNVLEFAKL
jgi:hypothetical protein